MQDELPTISTTVKTADLRSNLRGADVKLKQALVLCLIALAVSACAEREKPYAPLQPPDDTQSPPPKDQLQRIGPGLSQKARRSAGRGRSVASMLGTALRDLATDVRAWTLTTIVAGVGYLLVCMWQAYAGAVYADVLQGKTEKMSSAKLQQGLGLAGPTRQAMAPAGTCITPMQPGYISLWLTWETAMLFLLLESRPVLAGGVRKNP